MATNHAIFIDINAENTICTIIRTNKHVYEIRFQHKQSPKIILHSTFWLFSSHFSWTFNFLLLQKSLSLVCHRKCHNCVNCTIESTLDSLQKLPLVLLHILWDTITIQDENNECCHTFTTPRIQKIYTCCPIKVILNYTLLKGIEWKLYKYRRLWF